MQAIHQGFSLLEMVYPIVDLNEADLLAKMRNYEDHFVERKVVKDEKDCRKTAVAFANSAPVGFPTVLYIGVRNNGEIETPQNNLDEAQKRFNTTMTKVCPPIAYTTKVISDGGKQALAVIIPGSELKPQFAGCRMSARDQKHMRRQSCSSRNSSRSAIAKHTFFFNGKARR